MLFGNEEASIEEENEWLSFPHKMIHEYVAAHFLVREIGKDQRLLKELFSTWTDIKRHEEVYAFCIGHSSNSRQVSVFISHFCAVLSDTMIKKVKIGNPELTHSGKYKMDTFAGRDKERTGHSDRADLLQILTAISREAGAHRNTCFNPACNEYIHVFPACRNNDPTHIAKSKLIIFTEPLEIAQHLRMSAPADNMPDRNSKDKKCLVLFGDNDNGQDLTGINSSLSHCNIAYVYMGHCILKHSVKQGDVQNVNNVFTESLQTLYMKSCTLPDVLQEKIGHGQAGSEAMKVVRLWGCTGVTLNLVNFIASCTTLTKLLLTDCKLSSEVCGVLCRQLKNLRHLVKLGLSRNPLGKHIAHMTDAIKAWGPRAPLEELYLHGCQLPADLIPPLLSAVTQCCPVLSHLGIGGSSVGGSLPGFVAAAPASLQFLWVYNCNLRSGDVASITRALSHNTLQQIEYLGMNDNILTDNVVEPMLQAANNHHIGKLEVDLRNNKLSPEFNARWSNQSKQHLHLHLKPQRAQ